MSNVSWVLVVIQVRSVGVVNCKFCLVLHVVFTKYFKLLKKKTPLTKKYFPYICIKIYMCKYKYSWKTVLFCKGKITYTAPCDKDPFEQGLIHKAMYIIIVEISNDVVNSGIKCRYQMTLFAEYKMNI